MKKPTLKYSVTMILFISFSSINMLAQDIKGGTVKYENVTKFVYTDPSEGEYTEFMNTLPKSKTITQMLYFNNKSSVFEEEKIIKEMNQKKDYIKQKAAYFMNPIQKIAPKLQKLYYDLNKKEKIEQYLFLDRFFLVESKLKTGEWKIVGESKNILGYPCQKAILDGIDKKVIAWFTTEIPVATGPAEYIGLPGLILEVIVGDNNIVLKALSVDLTLPPKKNFSEPKEGKKMTLQQFEKTKAEKIKEWEEMSKNKQEGMQYKKIR